MSVISAREKLWAAMDAGISPTIDALHEFREEFDEFLADLAEIHHEQPRSWAGLEFQRPRSVTTDRLRKMLGYTS